MKYGIREICDVVLKAKAKMTIGDKVFYKDEPVIYFDSLKTSTLEGAATTVYAQGGRGNSRLVAWEGERTVTFTMEDALISTTGLAILTGANIIKSTTSKPIIQHISEIQTVFDNLTIEDGRQPTVQVNYPVYASKDGSDYAYVMKLDDNGNIASEPYIYTLAGYGSNKYMLYLKTENYDADVNAPKDGDVVLVDYYTARKRDAEQIEITPDKFGGNFYLEASTLFRNTNGVDMPAEFVIPNCKIQSNFTFTMASSGDPSTFTFTMDAFPDYTRWNKEKKVLSAIQIITDEEDGDTDKRIATDGSPADDLFIYRNNKLLPYDSENKAYILNVPENETLEEIIIKKAPGINATLYVPEGEDFNQDSGVDYAIEEETTNQITLAIVRYVMNESGEIKIGLYDHDKGDFKLIVNYPTTMRNDYIGTMQILPYQHIFANNVIELRSDDLNMMVLTPSIMSYNKLSIEPINFSQSDNLYFYGSIQTKIGGKWKSIQNSITTTEEPITGFKWSLQGGEQGQSYEAKITIGSQSFNVIFNP